MNQTCGFHSHALILPQKQRGERADPEATKTQSALDVLIMHSGTPETDQNQGISNCDH